MSCNFLAHYNLQLYVVDMSKVIVHSRYCLWSGVMYVPSISIWCKWVFLFHSL